MGNSAGRRREVEREGVRVLREAGKPSNSPTEAVGADPMKPGPSLAVHPRLGSQVRYRGSWQWSIYIYIIIYKD